MSQSSNVLSFIPPGSESGPCSISPLPSHPSPMLVTSDTDTTLRKIAEAALSATGASGAALAMRRDGTVVCQARAGEMAPPLGAQLDDRSGMSGECLRTGQALRCEDTETDERVDGAACRVLGIRSLAVAPVKNGDQVAGILEVFSPRPSSFTERHIDVLRQLAELVLEDAEPVVEPPTFRMPSSSGTAAAMVSSALSSAAPSAPPPTVLAPGASLIESAPPASPAIPPAPNAPSVATSSSTPIITVSTLLPKRPSPGDVNIAAYMAADETAHSLTRSRAPYPVLVGLAAIVIAFSLSWWAFHRATASAAQQASPAAFVAPVAAFVAPTTERSTLVLNKPNTTNPITQHVQLPDAKSTRQSLTKAASLDRIATSSREVTRPLHVVLSPKANPSDSDTPPALTGLGTADSTGNETVSSLIAAPVSLPQRALPISQGVIGGELERKVAAVYPVQARSIRQVGTVVLHAMVAKDGSVQDVTVISGPALLRQAATDAVKQWKYKPYSLNGQPVAVQTEVKMEFKMQ
jgi:TonB family protein